MDYDIDDDEDDLFEDANEELDQNGENQDGENDGEEADDAEPEEEDEDMEDDQDEEEDPDADVDADAEPEADSDVNLSTTGTTNAAAEDEDADIEEAQQDQKDGILRSFKQRHPIKPAKEYVECSSYDIIPYVALPHSCHIYSVASSWGMKWLFTGGSDGFIRRYNFADSVNGKVPLTLAQKHSFVDTITKAGVLTSYWENEQPVYEKDIRTGPDGMYVPKLSPVYSMAVQSEALWLLAGLESGGITLQTVRHNEGLIHAYLNKHKSAVSVLQLDEQETHLLSGSWDKTVIEWDLNTCQPIIQYTEPTGQLSSLEWQPQGGSYAMGMEARDILSGLGGLGGKSGSGSPVRETSSGQDAEEDNEQDPTQDQDDNKSIASLFGDDDNDEHDNFDGNDNSNGKDSEENQNENDNENDNINGNVNEDSVENGGGSKHEDNGKNGRHESQDAVNDDNQELSSGSGSHGVNSPNGNSNGNSNGHGKPASTPVKSNNVFMTSTIDGAIDIWDRRVGKRVAHMPVERNVTPPWCMSACWSTDGNFVYAGRRNSTIDEYDIRKFSKPSRVLKFPTVSGPVSAVSPLPSGRHILCGSNDNIRLYDLTLAGSSKTPFYIIPGHHGGGLSHVSVDPSCRYMVSASGSRGWQGVSTEVALIYEIEPLA